MDYSTLNHKAYIGKPISELPTPSFVVSLPIVERNIARLHSDVEKLGIGFRPHVKTLKTTEVTRMMLANGKYRNVVASTMAEIRGLIPLVQEGILDECLYGLPVCPGYIRQLIELRKSIKISLMVDNEQQVEALESLPSAQWDVFIKLDVGSHRAGVYPNSDSLHRLVRRIESSAAVRLYGFYCHAGHSYAGTTRDDADATLAVEMDAVTSAASILPADRELVVSIGATPTAHVVAGLRTEKVASPNLQLELHAGNFICNDLQQASTALVDKDDLATRVVTEVCSVYPERNEALINAGVIALSREPAHAYPGFGRLVGKQGWVLSRLSQEHGILTRSSEEGVDGGGKVEDEFRVGDQVLVYCNHACITAAAFFVYYIVDENDVVVDTWIPWKGW